MISCIPCGGLVSRIESIPLEYANRQVRAHHVASMEQTMQSDDSPLDLRFTFAAPAISRLVAFHGADSGPTATSTDRHNSYSTSFPLTQNPISEGECWINGGALGLDWTNVSTTPGIAIGHQVGPDFTDATALLSGTWGPDQTAMATVYTVDQNDACYQEVELRLRSTNSAHVNTGYKIIFNMCRPRPRTWASGGGTVPLECSTASPIQKGVRFGIKNRVVVSAKIVGNVNTAYINGVQKGQVDITSIGGTVYTTGSPGMGFNLVNAPAGCAGTNSNYGFTKYTATDAVIP